MDIHFLNAQHPSWSGQISHLYTLLGGAQNPTLFPYHFLQAVLPRIGGAVAIVRQEETPKEEAPTAVGFLFPRLSATTVPARDKAYTLRYHVLSRPTDTMPDLSPFLQACERQLAAPVIPYDPQATHNYEPNHQEFAVADIGRPDKSEAVAIRDLQQQVWGSPPEFLYPADIHSTDFGLASSLVARINGRPAGFLFGFLKFSTPDRHGAPWGGDPPGAPLPADWSTRFNGDVRIESQALGVLLAHRGARLGFLLKRVQAQQALNAGVQVINWTVDPLQWPNALLNFGILRAIALNFAPDYYPFRNELNRVTASRFSLTWLVKTERVARHCRFDASKETDIQPVILDLDQANHIRRVNDGWSQFDTTVDADQIAIEIPAGWTALQRDHVDTAMHWRASTDMLFQHYIGSQPGQYVVTGVGVAGPGRYLVAERIDADCWSRLSQ